MSTMKTISSIDKTSHKKNHNPIDYDKLVAFLKEQVKPALGCTEPVAVAIASSTAYKQIKGSLHNVNVKVSPNIFKNGMRVGIPGTSEKGLIFATALSLICGDPDWELEIFKNVNDENIIIAKQLIDLNIITIEIEDKKSNFYIEAKITTDNGSAKCVIEDSHTNIVLIEVNNQIIFHKIDNSTVLNPVKINIIKDLKLSQIKEFIENVSFEKIEFLLEGVKLNMDIAIHGLKQKSGAGIGAALNHLLDEKIIANDMVNQVRILTASACDARMSGVSMPVMSSAGSGNHGIIAIIPPTVISNEFGFDNEKLARALALSHLVTCYIKEFTGKLSPVCGCAVAAGIGASAAITWLLGGTLFHIAGSIKNMIGTIAGMICDGAKDGCAFKLSAASAEAVIQAQLALNHIIISELDGIVHSIAETTIEHLGKLCTEGAKDLDKKIIEIMLER